jgi:hypothetical protein
MTILKQALGGGNQKESMHQNVMRGGKPNYLSRTILKTRATTFARSCQDSLKEMNAQVTNYAEKIAHASKKHSGCPISQSVSHQLRIYMS